MIVEVISNLKPILLSWLPFLLTLAGFIIVYLLAKYLITFRMDETFSEHRIARHIIFLGIFIFFVIVMTISLPINETLRGQLLGLLGIMATAVIALSSTTFVGNAMAGLMLRIVRNIQPGDFISTGEHWGRISEFGFLHTEIQTEERTLTTLPNLFLVTNPVNVVRSSGTIISASVSLGYDIPHHRIEESLKKAAQDAGLTDPYVQIMELGDFSVSYRISGFLEEVKHLVSARSRLREKMLDSLHEHNIEIVSPTFMNQRALQEGQVFIPRRHLKPTGKNEDLLNGNTPEDLIFDKAEQAESAEEVKQKIKEYEKSFDELKEKKDESLKRDMEILERKISWLKTRYKKLTEKL